VLKDSRSCNELGPIEAADLRWYLEKFFVWPDRYANGRAEEIRAKFQVWGKSLFDESAGANEAKEALAASGRPAGRPRDRDG
jgi:hypothetical protein